MNRDIDGIAMHLLPSGETLASLNSVCEEKLRCEIAAEASVQLAMARHRNSE